MHSSIIPTKHPANIRARRAAVMPAWSRYPGSPIDRVQDGAELYRCLQFPNATSLTPAQRQAIENRLLVADRSGIEDAQRQYAAMLRAFVLDCRDAIGREEAN